MTDDKTIAVFFRQDHERLDALFKRFHDLKRTDFQRAKNAFVEFRFGLQRHIRWEEELLFPLWEERTGMSEGGPTFVMRAEHRQIGELLEAIHDKVAGGDPESDQEEQALLCLLGLHNVKEERILYPSIDQVTTAEDRKGLYRQMDEIPAARDRSCCGMEEKP
ncbi:MAG TPA: hemerythrin domain-containing protein [Nitrospira sp.]|nr:hemerythrin domain-containing protein [Nitrospira sp.]